MKAAVGTYEHNSLVKLEVVKVKGSGLRWAQKATWNNQVRYRGFYYKREAVKNLPEWEYLATQMDWSRNFYHNFNTAAELGITEVI